MSKVYSGLSLKAGDLVKLKGSGGSYTVLEGPDKSGRYSIAMASMHMWVSAEKLTLIRGGKSAESLLAPREVCSFRSSGRPLRSLDLHGYTPEKALELVEAAVDAAVLASIDELFIIHGIGSGRLKEMVHAYLESSGQVKSYRLDEFNRGLTRVFL